MPVVASALAGNGFSVRIKLSGRTTRCRAKQGTCRGPEPQVNEFAGLAILCSAKSPERTQTGFNDNGGRADLSAGMYSMGSEAESNARPDAKYGLAM